MNSNEDFCRKLPKVDLHSHIAGSISLELLKKYVMEKYPDSFEEIFKKCKIDSSESRELSHCFEIFKWIHKIFDDLAKLRECVLNILEEFYRENCIMLELRSTPRKMKDGNEEEYVKTILDAIYDFSSKKEDFFVGFVFSINRSKPISVAEDTLKLFQKFKSLEKYEKLVLGFDFSGNCFDNTFEYYLDVFKKIKELKFKTTLHFAEKEDHKDSKILLDYKPERIGHACFLNEEIQERMLKERIPLEICLTSNIMSRSVKELKKHQFGFFYCDHQYPVCLNTDDCGVFSTTISEEYRKAAESFSLKKSQLIEISKMGIMMSFFDEDEKIKALKILEDFEKRK